MGTKVYESAVSCSYTLTVRTVLNWARLATRPVATLRSNGSELQNIQHLIININTLNFN